MFVKENPDRKKKASHQPKLVIPSGVHSSQHPDCHHQFVFAKFNLTVFYPPPYERLVWHYQQANTDPIKRGIELFG